MKKEQFYKAGLSLAVVLLWSYTAMPLQGKEQTEPLSLTQTAVEAMKAYPSSFEDQSLKVSPIYSINDKGPQKNLVTVSEDAPISVSSEYLDKVLSETCPVTKEGEKQSSCQTCNQEEAVCGTDETCLTDTCCSCCCEEEVESLTGLAAVGVGGGGGGGGWGGGGWGGGGGGGGSGGGGGGHGGGHGGNNGVPIPEPATWLILGGMTSMAAYMKKKKSQKKQ